MKRLKQTPTARQTSSSAELAQSAADAARETVAGAMLCSADTRDLALLLELARPLDRRALGKELAVRAYALEHCDLPAVARLTSANHAGREFVRLEVFRFASGGWVECGAAVLELSAAQALAGQILKIETPIVGAPEPVQ